MIRIAVSKGRIAENTISQLEQMGYKFSGIPERQLWVKDQEKKLHLLFVKGKDVLVYLEKGAAELGVIGKDVLLEEAFEAETIMDLRSGRCKMCLAGPIGKELDKRKSLRIASKYPVISEKYLSETAIKGKITVLQGSLELAPEMGLSDGIIDIVESGKTLEAHGLTVYRELFSVSSLLIKKPSRCREMKAEIAPFIKQWKTWVDENLKEGEQVNEGFRFKGNGCSERKAYSDTKEKNAGYGRTEQGL